MKKANDEVTHSQTQPKGPAPKHTEKEGHDWKG